MVADGLSVDVTEIIDTAYGLVANGNDIRVNLAATTALEFTSGALRLKDALAGAGLLMTAQVLDIQTKEGIEIDADFLRVDEEYNFQWDGDQVFTTLSTVQFDTPPQVNEDLDFSLENRTLERL